MEKQTESSIKTKEPQYTYTNNIAIGSGAFGTVYQSTIVETGEVVAIKKVFQDKRYRNRELQILQEIKHPNLVELKSYFYTNGEKEDDLFLNCVMDYLPMTLSKIISQSYQIKQQINTLYIKLYAYQMIKGIAYIHSIGICHRDIKPSNILINPDTHELKICDFGSAKKLVKGQPNIAYICSRYYRAPELIFGATEYTNQIDVWSVGCVIAELVLGKPIFPGESASDQLVEIIKILGTPTKDQVFQMNPEYKEHKFPPIKPYSWEKLYKNKLVTPEYINLINQFLVYDPKERITPMKALCHTYFDELRDKNTTLPNKVPLPSHLFQFTNEEIALDPESAKYLMKA